MIRLDIDVPLAYTVVTGLPNTFQGLIFETSTGAVYWQSPGGVQRAVDNQELITVFYQFPVEAAKNVKVPGTDLAGEIRYSNIVTGDVPDLRDTNGVVPEGVFPTGTYNKNNDQPHKWLPTPTTPYGPHRMGEIGAVVITDEDPIIEPIIIDGVTMGTLTIQLIDTSTVGGVIQYIRSKIDIELNQNISELVNEVKLVVEFNDVDRTVALTEDGDHKWTATVDVNDIGLNIVKVNLIF